MGAVQTCRGVGCTGTLIDTEYHAGTWNANEEKGLCFDRLWEKATSRPYFPYYDKKKKRTKNIVCGLTFKQFYSFYKYNDLYSSILSVVIQQMSMIGIGRKGLKAMAFFRIIKEHQQS